MSVTINGKNPTQAQKQAIIEAFGLLTSAEVASILAQVTTARDAAQQAAADALGITAFVQTGTGAVTRTALDKMREVVSVNDRGGAGDGTTNNSPAIVLADANDAAVVFIKGTYRISSNVTINKDAIFWPTASLVIDAGVTVTFNGDIVGGPWQIFTGAGAVLLNAEDSHTVKPEWWGAVPDAPTLDSSVPLQKLSDSVVTGRECFVEFGDGTWYLGSKVTWSRACHVLGVGERITHFRCNASFTTGDVFDTAEQGTVFENLQFSSAATRTSGAYLRFRYNYCRALNIWFTDGFGGVLVEGNSCEVKRVRGFTWSSATGSYIVNLASGFSGSEVDSISYTDTAGTAKPEYLVRVDAHTLFSIDHLNGRGVGTVLGIVPSSGTAGRGQVGSVIAQSPTTNGVVIQSTGTAAIEGVQIGRVTADAVSGYGIKMQKDGSGIFKYIEIDGLEARSFGTGGFKVDASSGSLDHWHLKGGFCRGGTGNGYDIANADYWTVTGTESVSNSGTGAVIAAGCASFIYVNNRNLFNTTAQLTDSSGAVTKAVANNI